MPILKRATTQLKEVTGDQHLYVVSGLWGYSMRDARLTRQQTRCFKRVDQLLAAAQAGLRPHEPPANAETEQVHETARQHSGRMALLHQLTITPS
jgi:hypothetical protein